MGEGWVGKPILDKLVREHVSKKVFDQRGEMQQ